MTRPTKERRRTPRVVAKLAMQIAGVGDDVSVLTTESINLSAGGLQFQSKLRLEPLTKVALTLLLPPFGRRLRRERVVHCEGIIVRAVEIERVRNKQRYELACCFTGLSEENRDLLEQYVVWRSMRRITAPGGASAKKAVPAARRSSAGR